MIQIDMEKPNHCLHCPMRNSDDECVLIQEINTSWDWEEQYANCPLQEVDPGRKKGKWIWQIENRYVCSECGHHTQVDELFEEPMYAFCPYCSTSMLDEDGNVRYER